MANRVKLMGAVAVAIAVLAAAPGCGTATEAPAKGEFIRQAEAICKGAEKERAEAIEVAYTEALKPGEPLDEATEMRLIVEVALPPVRRMADELGGLTAPAGDEAQMEAIVDAYREAVEEVGTNPRRALTETRQIFHKPHKLARSYGFDYCAKA